MKKFFWLMLAIVVVFTLMYLDIRFVIPFYWSPEIRYTDCAYSIIGVFAGQCLLIYWIIEKILGIYEQE